MDIIQKTRDDYNKIAVHYAKTRNHEGELIQFKSFLAPGQHVLDWGCGNARLLYLLKKFDVQYCGLDQSSSLIKLAKKEHADAVKKGQAKFFCTAYKEKKFAKDFFDLAFLVASYHHLPDVKSRKALLKKIFTECKPGAHIIITVWNLESDWAKKKYKSGWDKFGPSDYVIPWKDENGKTLVERYYHNFSQAELKELLEDAGFTVEKMYFCSGVEAVSKKEGKNLVAIAKK